jgi:tocopherol O-methyltransferase
MSAPSNMARPPDDVGRHYDELDAFYRDVWGEHLHHGLWVSGRETPEEAAWRLADFVIEESGVKDGDAVCDVGCGYGATARRLAQEHGARVTALTVSEAQYDYARSLGGDISYRLQDWLANDLPASSFDAVIAIECASHMADRRRFIKEAYRVLRPGGRLVACAWLASDDPAAWQQRLLLEPIIREGKLSGLDPAAAYHQWIADAGFAGEAFQDLSRQVRRTWRVCLRRLAGKLLSDRRYRQYLLDAANTNRQFPITMGRLYAAYWTGAMRYGVFTARRPTT